jgi:hypothetical protein
MSGRAHRSFIWWAETRAVRLGPPLILGLALAVVLWTLPGESATSCRGIRPDRAEWQAARQGSLRSRSPTTAEALAADLVRCRVTIGMGGRKVLSLLGRPDRTAATGGGRTWLYQLDLDRGILSRPEFLRLTFGSRSTVWTAQLVTTS